MKDIAEKIGAVGCLAVAAFLWINGYTNAWVIALGVLGVLKALME